ncbi:hypothetical protein H4R18_002721 [Coemansia javaensis]|uniref:Uncharacterized protein n=1 Tax=Coemansia javaensis TaxID=2761396 RepID=A0A9W8HHI4_9FUNG|nr:hypothetical protein H4R18_002721 [Coemansia javaensis]
MPPRTSSESANAKVHHRLNWCRVCKVCLDCPREPRRVFNTSDCVCGERIIENKTKKNSPEAPTVDFRYRKVDKDERAAMTMLQSKINYPVPEIEPNLAHANMCGSCQQRVRNIKKSMKEPLQDLGQSPKTPDFRSNSVVSITILDADGSSLLTEKVLGNMPLDTLFNAFCPGAPARVLFRDQETAPATSAPMLTHRKNWCRVCGTCLTCPRTQRAVFQKGTCHCVKRQANHVHPTKVKGEMLFSFRYRHLSAEDVDILSELRPRFNFVTPPIERSLGGPGAPRESQPGTPVSGCTTQSGSRSPEHTPDTSDEELDQTRVDLGTCGGSDGLRGPALPLLLPPPMLLSRPQSPLPQLPPPHMLLAKHPTQRGSAAPNMHRMSPNVEFRDAANTVLFQELLSGDYPLEEIFGQYYPDAPSTLLFYMEGNIALPRSTTLRSLHSQCEIRRLPVVIWVRMPVPANPQHTPQWQAGA